MSPSSDDIDRVLRTAYDGVEAREGGWLLPGSLSAGRVWIQSFSRAPDRKGAIYDALESGRRAAGADRAAGVLLKGQPPEDAVPEGQAAVRIYSFRDFLLEVTGLAARMRRLVAEHHNRWEGVPTLPWYGEADPADEEVEAVEYVVEWLRDPSRPTLLLAGPAFARRQVVDAARERAEKLSGGAPAAVLEDYAALLEVPEPALRWNALVPYVEVEPEIPHVTLERLLSARYLVGTVGEPFAEWPLGEVEVLELRPFDLGELVEWMLEQHPPEGRPRLRKALDEFPDLMQLADDPASYPCILQATRRAFESRDGAATLDPVPLALRDYVTRTLDRELGDPLSSFDMEEIALLEEAAFYDYVGGRGEPLAQLGFGELEPNPRILGWLEEEEDVEGVRFANELVRNALVAMKVARDVRLGRQEALERYRFPERDLRQHLRALLPPELLSALDR